MSNQRQPAVQEMIDDDEFEDFENEDEVVKVGDMGTGVWEAGWEERGLAVQNEFSEQLRSNLEQQHKQLEQQKKQQQQQQQQ